MHSVRANDNAKNMMFNQHVLEKVKDRNAVSIIFEEGNGYRFQLKQQKYCHNHNCIKIKNIQFLNNIE